MPGNHGSVEITQSDQELVTFSKKKIRRIRLIIIVLGILIAIGLIATLVILLLNNNNNETSSVELPRIGSISLDDVLAGKFRLKKFDGEWFGSNIIYKDEDKLVELKLSSLSKTTLLNLNSQKYKYSFGHEKSPDGQYLLIAKEYQKYYRHSYLAKYEILNLKTQATIPVLIKGEHESLFLAKWAPVGNSLILNFEGNLYYKQNPLAPEIQLTEQDNQHILNGIPDWVYEEEVFSSNVAVWFNPNATKLAYVQFDDTPSRLINIPVYGEPGSLNFQYPLNKPVVYPKSGSPNPFVKLYQIDLENLHEGSQVYSIPVPVPSALNTQSHIITIVQWLSDDQLLSVWMNRIQNSSHFEIFTNTKRYDLIKYESRTGWVDLFTPFTSNINGSQIAVILPHKQGDAGDFRHLTLIPIKDNSKLIPITKGKFVVESIKSWDTDYNIIFYMANTPEKSEVLHLYAIKAAKNEKPQCITCSIKVNGVHQSVFSAEFSQSGKYIEITSLGPSVPSANIYKYSLSSGNIIIKQIFNWEDNHATNELISKMTLPSKEIYTINIDGGFTAKVLLLVPPVVNKTASKKYPMLIEVYGGPDSNAVADKFNIDYGTYLAMNRSIIYAKIDGRGSGLRGDKLLHSIYLNLGTFEVYDQIDVVKSLTKLLPFIDPDRIGIWGWSYGGYISGMALANSDIFKCAVSVAPVTDWLYYDTIYTERYMKTPEENEFGYIKARLSTLGFRFHFKKYLLIHGTLDDNVHYQQGMMLAKNLERNDVLFKQITYPDEDHSLANVRPHLYNSLDRFFGSCFNLEVSHYFR